MDFTGDEYDPTLLILLCHRAIECYHKSHYSGINCLAACEGHGSVGCIEGLYYYRIGVTLFTKMISFGDIL